MQLIFILLFFYAIPLELTFQIGLNKFISDTFFNLGLILFIVDNLVSINTTFYKKGVPV
jgi:hypothetical protein